MNQGASLRSRSVVAIPLIRHLAQGHHPGSDAGEWEDTSFAYRDHVIASTATDGSADSSDYIAFARARFLEVAESPSTDMGKGDSDKFIDGLAAELSVSSDLPSDPAVAIRLVL